MNGVESAAALNKAGSFLLISTGAKFRMPLALKMELRGVLQILRLERVRLKA